MNREIQIANQNGMGNGKRLPDGRSSEETVRLLCALRGWALVGYAFYYARMTWTLYLETLSPQIERLALSKMYGEICQKFLSGEWSTTDYSSPIIAELNYKWSELIVIS